MKIRFSLKAVSGLDLHLKFMEGIEDETVGGPCEWGSQAALSPDGTAWWTAFSKYSYWIINPTSPEPAVVEYEGPWRGFLAQKLIPEELRGETTSAEVVGGSVLVRFTPLKHDNATELAAAYGLLQEKIKRKVGSLWGMTPEQALEVTIRAVKTSQLILRSLIERGEASNSARPLIHPYSGDPAVLAKFVVKGRFVETWVSADRHYSPEDNAKRFKEWLGTLV